MKKVLVVDDSLTIGRQLRQIIAGAGEFEVIGHVQNGAEAIQRVQKDQPDIVCMDMNMPVMDGLTALRSMTAVSPKVKVVMITSLGGSADKFTEAIKLGAKNVISKPFQADEVLKILRAL